MDNAVAHRVSGSFHWQLALKGIRLGDESLDIKTTFMLTDTGATLTHLPEEDFNTVIDKLCDGLNCYPDGGFYYVSNCDVSVFEPLWFQIDLHWYKVPPESYLVLVLDEQSGELLCQFRLQPNGDHDSYGVLGINFLENYF